MPKVMLVLDRYISREQATISIASLLGTYEVLNLATRREETLADDVARRVDGTATAIQQNISECSLNHDVMYSLRSMFRNKVCR